jgi:hypothetical protein
VTFQDQEFQDHSLNVNRTLTAYHRWLVSALSARIHAQWLMSAHQIKNAVFLTHYHFVQLCVSVPQIPLLIAMAIANKLVSISVSQITFYNFNMNYLYRMFNLKVDCVLIRVIYLLRFTTWYITQLTCIYSKCWKWCPFISMHLSTRFTMFLITFLSVLSFFNYFRNSTFYWCLPSIFQRNFVYSGLKTSFLNNVPK